MTRNTDYKTNNSDIMTNTEQDFEKHFAGSEKYEHIPLPESVKKLLKLHHNGYTLHAFIAHDKTSYGDGKDHRTMVLAFDKITNTHIAQGPGVCCGMDNGYIHNWKTLAEEIAFSWPEYSNE